MTSSKKPAGRLRAQTALTFGVSEHRVRDAGELQRLAPQLADEVHAGNLKLAKALAMAKREEQLRLIASTEPPEGRYRTIVADPPWHYQDAWCSGAAAHHYVTMSDDEVKELRVSGLADTICHLYLWAGAPKLAVAFEVVTAWGFEFKTLLVWKKNKLGLGRYYRSQTEFVLFATKGKAPLQETALPNYFEAPVTKHSEKPDAFYELVERASFGPRIDMYARKQRPGWKSWGAEAGAGDRTGPRGPAHPQDGGAHQAPREGSS